MLQAPGLLFITFIDTTVYKNVRLQLDRHVVCRVINFMFRKIKLLFRTEWFHLESNAPNKIKKIMCFMACYNYSFSACLISACGYNVAIAIKFEWTQKEFGVHTESHAVSKVCGNTGSYVAHEHSPTVIVLLDFIFTTSALQVRRNILVLVCDFEESRSTVKLNCHLWQRLRPTVELRKL